MVGEVAEGDISKEDGSIVHGIHGVAIEHIISRKNKNGYKSVRCFANEELFEQTYAVSVIARDYRYIDTQTTSNTAFTFFIYIPDEQSLFSSQSLYLTIA